MEEAVGQLAGSGVLGAILLLLGYAYAKQSQDLARVNEARVEDAKRIVETMLALQDRWQTTVADLTEAVQRLKPSNQPPPQGGASQEPIRLPRRT